MTKVCEEVFEWIEKPLLTAHFAQKFWRELNEYWSEFLSDIIGREVRVIWYIHRMDLEIITPIYLTDDEIGKICSIGLIKYPNLKGDNMFFHLEFEKNSKPCKYAKPYGEYLEIE